MSVVGAVGPGFTRERVDDYWAAFRSAGDEGPWAETPRVGTTRHVVVADTDEEARAIARRAWAVHADHVFEIPFGLGGETAVRGTAGMGVGEDADEVIARRTQLVAGSPETVREILAGYVEELGPGHNYLVGSFQWGDISHAEASRSLELYAGEVMPALQGRRGRGAGAPVSAPAQTRPDAATLPLQEISDRLQIQDALLGYATALDVRGRRGTSGTAASPRTPSASSPASAPSRRPSCRSSSPRTTRRGSRRSTCTSTS